MFDGTILRPLIGILNLVGMLNLQRQIDRSKNSCVLLRRATDASLCFLCFIPPFDDGTQQHHKHPLSCGAIQTSGYYIYWQTV
jgi:hypothetical protein